MPVLSTWAMPSERTKNGDVVPLRPTLNLPSPKAFPGRDQARGFNPWPEAVVAVASVVVVAAASAVTGRWVRR